MPHSQFRSNVTRLRITASVAIGICLALATIVTAAKAAPQPGAPAPAFIAVDADGKTHRLADYRGKTVVLEWTNHQCPYTVKHYRSGNMQMLQKAATTEGIVWLSIISSAPGRQGYVTPAEAKRLTTSRKAAPTAVLLDPEGKIGRLYNARTTPHMFIIDKDGKVSYMGAIDNRPSASSADIKGAKNYVADALEALKAGRLPAKTSTRPYGCSVKYGPQPS